MEPSSNTNRHVLRAIVSVAGAALVFALGLFGTLVYRSFASPELAQRLEAAREQRTRASQQLTAPDRIPRAQVETADDPALGPADAKVTIVEFADFECPFCRASVSVMKDLLKKYKANIRFIHRDYPNESIHPNARPAALAAACAHDQGKFWEYHDLLYINQERLSEQDLQQYARQLGVDTRAFTACLTNRVHNQEVTQDYVDGVRFGVSGTPTWFVNGRRIEGALPYDVFRKVIDAAAKGKL